MPLAAAGLLLACLAGCSLPLPQAQSDPTRFYVLSTSAAGGAAAANAPSIHLRPVELASYIKSKPMILRRGDNEIEFREYARWGEPLELGIGRVLREELLARGAAGAVLASGLRGVGVDYDYELTVRCWPARAAPMARSISGPRGSCRPPIEAGGRRPGRLPSDESPLGRQGEASLAATLSQAVAGLSREIAAGLAKAKG
jgi:uncharacterized lipoprotein YmbA